MLLLRSSITILCLLLIHTIDAQPTPRDVDLVMAKINLLRSSGLRCGKKYMPPVGPVDWNDELYIASNTYAKYMHRYKHFEHISREGEDLGDRLDRIGYAWLKIGENLAFGYDHFDETLQAWIDSPSHCTMLMDPDVTQMGMSKRGKYWAQSWGKPAPNFATK